MPWPELRDWLPAERVLDARLLDEPELERPERLPVARDDSIALDSFGPSVIASSRDDPLLERMSSAQSLTWSDKRLIWSLIWLRFDHRNTPAATAPAAAAAVFIGLSRAVSPQ
jgi:hypothetical protein